MVPMRKPHLFLNSWCSPRQLAAVLFIMLLVRDGDSNQQHRGEVGGKLTLYCSSNKHKEIKLFYLQRNSGQHNVEFVNGFYENRNISNTWPGTTLDRNNTSVHFHNLKVSNNGNYQCIIVYKDEGKSEETHRVFVTAPYSKPTVSVNCSDESHSYICMVTCSSHGGYPATKVTWNISVPVNHSGEAWKVFSSSEVSDPNSKLVNSSSTAHFNCSNRVPQSFGCSVGIVISDTFTVCEPEKPLESFTHLAIVAICATLFLGLLALLVLLLKNCRKRVNVDVESACMFSVEIWKNNMKSISGRCYVGSTDSVCVTTHP